MLTPVDRETIAAVLGADWEQFAPDPAGNTEADEKSERNIDTPEGKPEQ
jgi:hypothetical protein